MHHTLNTGGTGVLHVETQKIFGRGRVNPVLTLTATFRTTEGWDAELLNLRVRVSSHGELLGNGWVIGGSVTRNGAQEVIEIPTTHRMIQYVTDSMGQDPTVELEIEWSGTVRITAKPELTQHLASDPQPGSSEERRVHAGSPTNLYVPRSEWVSQVLTQIRQQDYVYLEIAVPRGDAAASWRSSLGLLAKAENAYANGDDASTFLHLRGVLDSLPGAKRHMFDALPEGKRQKIDTLTKAFGEYLHTGRHVANAGPDAGTFPVNHLDAAFAIALCKALLSYASLALPSGSGNTPEPEGGGR